VPDSFLSRFRRREAATRAAGAPESAEAGDGAPRPVRRPLPPAGVLRRERRALGRAREERIRDLGGLMLEMYKRDQFREDLLVEQAGELVALEQRLQEVDSLLAAQVTGRRRSPAARCECGAPVLWGSHFCANCGRPVGETAVVACTSCGHPLPADAEYCASCGAKVEEAVTADDEAADATAVRSAYEGSENLDWDQPPAEPRSDRSKDSWEE
jgi:DNA-directed RNA polymerase subunit RPC12/RpoP